MAKKSTTFHIPAPGLWKATAVDGRIEELRQKERDVLAAIIALEESGGQPASADDDRRIADRAAVFMNGEAPPRSVIPEPTLTDLRTDQQAIRLALATLEQVQTNERARRLDDALIEAGDAWRELVRELARNLCRLRWLNGLREEFRKAVPGAKFPCDRHRLHGAGKDPSDEVDAFFTDILKAGIVTQGELAKWTERSE
jgi:hypothetical protein